MSRSVRLSKSALMFKDTNNVTANKIEANAQGNLDISGILIGDFSGNLTGTVSSAAQTSITSVGTLSNLNVSGNVGVGTTNPTGGLSVTSSHASNPTESGIHLGLQNGLTPRLWLFRQSQAGTTGQIFFGNGNDDVSGDTLDGPQGEFSISTPAPAPHAMTFVTDGTERVRIDGSGNVGIGSISPQSALHVAGNCSDTGTSLNDGVHLVGINQDDGSGMMQLIGASGSYTKIDFKQIIPQVTRANITNLNGHDALYHWR